MHIPDSMLQGAVCPVTAAVSVAGVLAAAWLVMKAEHKPTAGRFAAVVALIFAGQMMNFPIMDGTSGHLLGGVLAAAVLGTPLGVLAIALVVTIQSLVFSDGGVNVLGANMFNGAAWCRCRRLVAAEAGGHWGNTDPPPWLHGVPWCWRLWRLVWNWRLMVKQPWEPYCLPWSVLMR